MADIEKVIRGLSECITGKHCNSEYCPYSNVDSCQAVLKNDVLELLKEQQRVIEKLTEQNEYLETKMFIINKLKGETSYG